MIEGINVYDYSLKEGDVKVNSEELKKIFILFDKYHAMLGCMLHELDETEREILDNGLQFVEYLMNKYLVLGDLRRKQKLWYDTLQKFNKKEFTQNATAEQIDNTRREVLAEYLDAKQKREELQKEIEETELKSFVYW